MLDITIEKLKLQDIKNYYKIQNKEEKGVNSYKDLIKYFIFQTLKKRKRNYIFGIKFRKKLIGSIEVFNICWNHKNSEIRYWLKKEYRQKGLMGKSLKLVIQFLFDNLELHKVYAKVYANNIGSIKLLEKLNFKLSGVFKQHRYRNGTYYDELHYEILNRKKE